MSGDNLSLQQIMWEILSQKELPVLQKNKDNTYIWRLQILR